MEAKGWKISWGVVPMRLNKLLSILLLVSLLAGCAPAPTSAPTATNALTATATPAPPATFAPSATPTAAPTATPDARTLPLTARAEGEEQIDNYPPAKAFTVHFSRPLDPKSAAAPLLTYPFILLTLVSDICCGKAQICLYRVFNFLM